MSKQIQSLDELISSEEVDVDEIIEIIINGNYDPKEMAKNGYSMISLACLYSLPEVAIALIQKTPEIVGEVLYTIELDEDDEPIEDSEASTITALQAAVITGLDEVSIELIQTGHSNIGFQNSQGKTALMYALGKGNLKIAQELIKTGESNPGVQSLDGDTALMLACQARNSKDVVSALIQTGQSNPGAKSYTGDTALIIACRDTNNEANISALIQTGQSDPGAQNNLGITALWMACSLNYYNYVELLIQTGQSNPGAKSITGNTALMLACENSNAEDIVSALIKTGQSDPGAQNDTGLTALITSCALKYYSYIELLLETGQSNPGAADLNDDTALRMLCREVKKKSDPKLLDIISKLIQTGNSNPGLLDIKGDTALMVLCSKAESVNVDKIALELIATGQSIPGFTDSQGFTPLIMCCQRNRYAVAKALIETGESNAFIRSSEEKTALDYLKPKGPPELIALLESEIAKLHSLISLDTSQMGFDMVGSQTKNIKQFLEESPTNACIKFDTDKYFLFSMSDLERVQRRSEDYYGSMSHTELVLICDSRNRQIRKAVYVDFKSVIPTPCLVSFANVSDLSERLEAHPSENTRCFLMTYTGHTVRGISALDGPFSIEDDQPCPHNVNKIYRLTVIERVDSAKQSGEPSGEQSSSAVSESAAGGGEGPRTYVRINYKNVQYEFDIVPGTTTIADLKQMFLAKLLETKVISSMEQIVRLIYPGKQFDDASIISVIITTQGQPLYGAQFTAMVRVPGGTRKRKNRKTKRRRNKKTKRNF
jgi:ankyrin repeat protein